MNECTASDNAQDRQKRTDAQLMIMNNSRLGVYPGVILVRKHREGGALAYPVEDSQFDPTTEYIIGVSAWGLFKEHCPGLWTLGNSTDALYVLPLTGKAGYPRTNTPRLDCWLQRANVVQDVLETDRFQSFGTSPLTWLSTGYREAALGHIVRKLRQCAAELLSNAPYDVADSLYSVASIADCETPSAKLLEEARQQLLATSSRWNPSAKTSKADRKNYDRATWPTATQLIRVADISTKVFHRIRTEAGIKHGLRGHKAAKYQFSPEQVAMMIEIVSKGSYVDRDQILDAWAPFSTSSTT